MKIFKFFFLLLILGSISCQKDAGERLFDFRTEVNLDIPPGLGTFSTHYFVIDNIPSRYKLQRESAGVSEESVVNILASHANIIPRFQDIDYGFIRDISLRFFNEEGEAKIEGFYLDEIKFSEPNELRLLSSISNLKEILSKPYFSLEIRINFKTFTPSNGENIIKLNFSAFAEI